MSLQFYQIYYQDSQLEHLYPFAIPYKNDILTRFFENSVIAQIIPNTTADYVSVCSWRLAQKRQDGPTPMILRNQLSLSEEKILGSDFDIAVLTPVKHKDIINKLNLWHGQNAMDAVDALRKFIRVPDEVDHVIYQNHFIARGSIYKDYVRNCLLPCMDFMASYSEDGRDIFFEDSGYITRKKHSPEEIERIKKALKRNDWPIAPFILERLFSIWIHGKGFKIINL